MAGVDSPAVNSHGRIGWASTQLGAAISATDRVAILSSGSSGSSAAGEPVGTATTRPGASPPSSAVYPPITTNCRPSNGSVPADRLWAMRTWIAPRVGLVVGGPPRTVDG